MRVRRSVGEFLDDAISAEKSDFQAFLPHPNRKLLYFGCVSGLVVFIKVFVDTAARQRGVALYDVTVNIRPRIPLQQFDFISKFKSKIGCLLFPHIFLSLFFFACIFSTIYSRSENRWRQKIQIKSDP